MKQAQQYKAAAFARKFDIDELFYWIELEGACYDALLGLYRIHNKYKKVIKDN